MRGNTDGFPERPGNPGGPSQAHIRFDAVDSIRPKENVLLSHKTWVNGKIAEGGADLLARLKVEPAKSNLCAGYFVAGSGRQNTVSTNTGGPLIPRREAVLIT